MSDVRELWAVVGTSEEDGVWAARQGDVIAPLVCASERLIPALVRAAELIRTATGKAYRVRRFQAMEELPENRIAGLVA